MNVAKLGITMTQALLIESLPGKPQHCGIIKKAMKVPIQRCSRDVQGEEMKSVPSGWWRPVLLFSFLAVALVLGKLLGVTGHLREWGEWIKSLGSLGYLVFVFFHIAAMVAAIPRSVLAVVAGVLFGSVMGIILVTISAPLGAGLAFLIARYFVRDATARWVVRNKKINRLYKIVEERGAVVLVATRLATFSPANVLNYAFGLTGISFATYMFWSFICMIPVTVLYVVGADTITKSFSGLHISWGLLSVVILLSTVAVVVGIRVVSSLGEK